MTLNTTATSILRRIAIAVLGRPIQALLDWQVASCHRAARAMPKNTPTARLDAALRRGADSRDEAYQWAEKVFRQRSGFPRPGWAARGGLNEWSGIAPARDVKTIPVEYLRQGKLLHELMQAPDAPWDNPECDADMRSLLSAHARFLSGSPSSAASGGGVLLKIPASLPHFAMHFCKEAALLDSEWHLRDALDNPAYQRVTQDAGWKEQVALAKITQEVFLESEELAASTSESTAPSRQSKTRL